MISQEVTNGAQSEHIDEYPNVLQENVGACLEALLNDEQAVSRQLGGKDEIPWAMHEQVSV